MPALPLWLVANTAMGANAALTVTAVLKTAAAIALSTAVSRAFAAKLPKGALASGSPIQMEQNPAPVGCGIYGTVRKSGPIAWARTQDDGGSSIDNRVLFLVIPVAVHQIDGFEEVVYLDDRKVTMDGTEALTDNFGNDYAGHLSHYSNQGLGADDQAANSVLVAEFPAEWGVNHRLRGIANAVVRLSRPDPDDPDDQEIFPGGTPNLSFLIRGFRVYDPRDEDQDPDDPTTWLFSANPALCLLHYLAFTPLGMRANYTDQILPYIDAWIASANVCDEDVDGEPRYTCGGSWETSAEPIDVILQLKACMAAELYYIDGSWILHAGAARTAEADPLTVDDLRGAVEMQPGDEIRDTCNRVHGMFTFPDDGYVQRGYPEAQSDVYLTEDNGRDLPREKQFPWVQSARQAQRLAWIELKQARQDISSRWECKLTALRYQAGDIVPVTFAPLGWSGKNFLIWRHEFEILPPAKEGEGPGIGIDLELREYAAASFDDEPVTDIDPAPNTTLPPYFP